MTSCYTAHSKPSAASTAASADRNVTHRPGWKHHLRPEMSCCSELIVNSRKKRSLKTETENPERASTSGEAFQCHLNLFISCWENQGLKVPCFLAGGKTSVLLSFYIFGENVSPSDLRFCQAGTEAGGAGRERGRQAGKLLVSRACR